MVIASILINQSGKPSGAPSVSRDDLDLGVPVILTNNDNTGVVSWLWEFISKPPASSAMLSTPIASSSSFTPDIRGSYFIRLVVSDGVSNTDTDERIGAVKTAYFGIRIPAAEEKGEFDATLGWATAMHAALISIDTDASTNFKKDGTVLATGNFNLNGNKITNLATPVASQDAATRDYVDTHLGTHAIGGPIHTASTLSELNTKISDATLDDSSASRPPNGAAAGDLGGTYPSPTVTKIQGRSISTLAPTDGYALIWNSSQSRWEPGKLASTLDQSYDGGNPGSGDGRQITVDAGALALNLPLGATPPALDINAFSSVASVAILDISCTPKNNNITALKVVTEQSDGYSGLISIYAEANDAGNVISSNINLTSPTPTASTIASAFKAAVSAANALPRTIGFDAIGGGMTYAFASGTTGEADANFLIDGYDGIVYIHRSISDPNNPLGLSSGLNWGTLYTKRDGYDTELFYKEHYVGLVSQITKDGYIDTYDGVPAVGLFEQISDPTFVANKGFVYCKDDGGNTELYYIDSSNNVIQITADGYINAGALSGGNNLDQAYDEGGPGAGREITADSGPVYINASGDNALDVDGYVSFREISDPILLDHTGSVYVKDVDGYSELFYIDSYGAITQITDDGYLAITSTAAQNNLDSTGSETYIQLSYVPLPSFNTDSGRDLQVYRNGILLRWISSLTGDINRWTYNTSLNRVEFSASGSSDWYTAIYNKR